MSYTIPREPPKLLVPGTTWKWYHQLSTDFPAATWALTYTLIGPAVIDSGAGWTITADTGSTHLVVVTAATTGAFTSPGRYRLIAFVTSGGETYVADECIVEIAPDYPDLTGDQRTHEEKMLALIISALEGRLTTQEEVYSIGGRSISKMPIAELNKLRGYYAAMVRRQRNPGRVGRHAGVEFGKPTL